MDKSIITFGYWGIRGRGQVTRLVLAYLGLPWQEKSYNSHEDWFANDRQSLGFNFPNLPYIIDGEVKIS
jgi:glutathione S-transferase